MTFPEALAAVFNDNARVTRRTWNNPRIYCSVVQQQLCISGYSSSVSDQDLTRPHPWTITESDFYSDDWEIIE